MDGVVNFFGLSAAQDESYMLDLISELIQVGNIQQLTASITVNPSLVNLIDEKKLDYPLGIAARLGIPFQILTFSNFPKGNSRLSNF